MTAKLLKPSNFGPIEQDLRKEIAGLQARLEDTRIANELRDRRRQGLSRMLKIGIWEWDEVDDKPIFYSDELAEIFDVEIERLNREFRSVSDFERLVHPDDLETYRNRQASSLAVKPGEFHSFDYRIIDRSGEARYLREIGQGVFDEKGELRTSFGLVQDVSEEFVSAQASRESAQRYSSLFAQLPLGIQEQDYSAIKKVVDKLLFQGTSNLEEYFQRNPGMLREMQSQTRVINVNEALLRMYGAGSLEAFVADEARIDDWWDAQWVSYFAAEVAGLAGSDRSYESDRVDSRLDGSLFQARTRVTVVRGYEETWERVITIHEDITERRQIESALIEARTQAEKANRTKSEILACLSQELRAPLIEILGLPKLPAENPDPGAPDLACASEIHRVSRQLLPLVEQLLDLERIDAGQTVVSLRRVALDRVLDSSLRWLEPMSRSHGVEIDYRASRFEGISVLADEERLEQVFVNLLGNAIRSNRRGGRVTLLSDVRDGRMVRIGIRDSDEGSGPERSDEMSDTFDRLEPGCRSTEEGAIGLTIACRLVALMNGKVEVQRWRDSDRAFWISLERFRAGQAAGVSEVADLEPEALEPGASCRARILVAEDNQVSRDLIMAQLGILGYEADLAEDGAAALALWRDNEYRVLVTDIRMPRMDGYALVREVRRLEEQRGFRCAVIAITASTDGEEVENCHVSGIDHVIGKPVRLETLRTALRRWAPMENSAGLPESAPPCPEPGTVIDLDVLRQSTGARSELHRSLFKSFQVDLSAGLSNIQQAFAWKNGTQVAEYCHKLKSSSRAVGATGLARECQSLETAARNAEWPEVESGLPRLQRAANQVDQFLRDHFREAMPPADSALRAQAALPALAGNVAEVAQLSLGVLVVDDDYIMQRVTTVILQDLGISSVLNAMSGPAALDLLDGGDVQIDVIVCDLNMPGMDGVELIRHLAQRRYEGSLILASGENIRLLKTVEKLAIEHDLHVLGVLEKPVTPARLGELLESLDQIRHEGTLVMGDLFGVEDLERAISNGDMDAFFQPKVDIRSGQVVGVEALARWNHPEYGQIRPNAFIGMAEENGLITPLTDAVCDRALGYAAELKAAGLPLNVAINISVDSLTNLEWPDRIARRLETGGLDAPSITFEITESRLVEHLSVALDILSRLSLKRFNLSIDDFGTGYSSMEQLQRIPFAELKIDRAFVHGAARDDSARAILESSILLARKLDMNVVAEGVEDREDWDLLAELGCDQVQGYYISRPLPYEQLRRWLSER